jgi:uncharacterized protein Usg
MEARLSKHRPDGTEGIMASQDLTAKDLSAKDLSAKDLSAKDRSSKDFRRQLEGYGLTTANILYRRPDHPWLLQTYVWQDYDLCPQFPELNKFLNFWLEKLEGPLHSVTVAHARLIKPAEIRAVDGEFRLH